MRFSHSKELVIASCPTNIAQVESFVEEIRKSFALRDEIYGNILISLTEAVNNAIHHGNNCDLQKAVCIECKGGTERLSFRIKDEGCGFDAASVPDPTLDENIDKLGGRGVFLMQQLADTVQYQDSGRVIILGFNL